ncbi:clathrin interactor EPSIN 1 isoform X2 [Gossypium hirsutum]|uniref:Clathrin interactor EPSIN 1 isoform X2 n=1 Tax=Gossypium hirsutum TaxID=3635 RepID=A0ABM3A2K9_GOSHI|nr:clathrin interactor EPSIN 1 isoform X2 [Gossypium hirsutum]XP_040949099.1 clathrin interactor EPSIN 1 isoform X2 [Gossypium hirsutum]
MDFMKVFDQTVREIKREVNLKVLKVPEIEQKVLDATDNEPWGPHGTALAEIAQATKKFSEFQMVMNVLWTRLGETGKDWRYVYKALTVIEYLISHGSERAVDDIIEHTFQISSLTSFEYVEPSGKDMGINVRKKAETIVGLLSNKEKIQEARNKAAANRDKSGGFNGGGDKYGGISSRRESDSYRDSYKESDPYGEEKFDTDTYVKSHRGTACEIQGNSSKESRHHGSKDSKKKFSSELNDSNKYSQSTSTPSNNFDDDFDDFDPRGTSSSKLAAGSSNQVDPFVPNLIDDLFDGPAPVPMEKSAVSTDSTDVDLFADATFVSAPTKVTHESSPQAQQQVDLFASQPAITPAASPTVDIFAAGDPVVQPHIKGQVDLFASQPAITPAASPTVDLFSTTDPVVQPAMAANVEPVNASIVDPFAAVPLNNFDGSDIFGSKQNPMNDGNLNKMSTKSSQDSKAPQKKDAFQVKSGIWADSLNRGIIDLNISAPKKVSLADVGIVCGLSDVDERVKGPPTSFYMGRAMGTGSGLGKTGFASTPSTDEDGLFSSLGNHQQYQFGSFKK